MRLFNLWLILPLKEEEIFYGEYYVELFKIPQLNNLRYDTQMIYLLENNYFQRNKIKDV